jgi:hypothetical protein
VARALIVGCGCRGRALGSRLLAAGWRVRGTTRRPEGADEILASGLEPALADPDRAATVLELVGDVTLVFWLLGSARGTKEEVAAIHGPRLERVLERLVDTPVRGFVYEAEGALARRLLEGGAEIVGEAGRRWRIPVAVVREGQGEPDAWAAAMVSAAERLTA